MNNELLKQFQKTNEDLFNNNNNECFKKNKLDIGDIWITNENFLFLIYKKIDEKNFVGLSIDKQHNKFFKGDYLIDNEELINDDFLILRFWDKRIIPSNKLKLCINKILNFDVFLQKTNMINRFLNKNFSKVQLNDLAFIWRENYSFLLDDYFQRYIPVSLNIAEYIQNAINFDSKINKFEFQYASGEKNIKNGDFIFKDTDSGIRIFSDKKQIEFVFTNFLKDNSSDFFEIIIKNIEKNLFLNFENDSGTIILPENLYLQNLDLIIKKNGEYIELYGHNQ